MINQPACRILARPGLTEEDVVALIQRSQEFSSLPEEERLRWLDFQSMPDQEGLLQNRRNRCVVLVRQRDGSPVCVKRYRCRGLWDALLGTFGRSRARLAWHNAERLQEHGFSVLLPLALWEEKTGPLIQDSYLISPALDPRTRLDHYIAEHFPPPLTGAALRQKRQLLRSLAGFLKKLHERLIYYREMQIDNFFVEERATGEWDYLFVDFDRIVFGKRLSLRQKAKNLAVLRATCQRQIPQSVSATDQVRFLFAYTQAAAWPGPTRELLAQVRELTARYQK